MSLYIDKGKDVMNDIKDVMLTEKECSEFLKISCESLRKRRMGRHPPIFYKIGKRVFYKKSDVLAFLESCKKDYSEK